jgi:LacI family transcriptional regulator
VVGACARLGLRVPDDVAVLGVDNDDFTCQFCSVPLSSVARNEWRVGYEAAAVLDRWMAKGRMPQAEVLIPPDHVVKRRSTDLVAVDNRHLAEVVCYVRAHLGERFGVKRLARVASFSRRWLERHFQEAFHCSPAEYISRLRVERAKELLAGTERLKIGQIARECGFSGARQFGTIFRRVAGVSPSSYRRQRTEAS